MNFLVRLDTIMKVKTFASICSRYDNLTIDLQNHRYVVDAKSIMGIFSLNLMDNLKLVIHDSDSSVENFLEEIKEFIIEE